MALNQLQQANALVIDLGTHTIRMGFAYDPCPTCMIKVASIPKEGTDLSARDVSYAIYTEFESKLRQYLVEPIPVLIIINHTIQPSFVFHLLDYFLSLFPGVAFHSSVSCAMYASTQTTAVVVDCGHTATRVALVIDGVIASIQVLPEFSGENMLNTLVKVLVEKHTALCSVSESPCEHFGSLDSSELLSIAQRLLTEHCAVSLNPDKDRELASTTFTYEETVTLPCNHTVIFNEELFFIAEDLLAQSRLAAIIVSILENLPLSLQAQRIKVPVVFVGGLAQLTNLTRRMQLELPVGTIIQSSDDSVNISWQGGASFVGIELFYEFLITRALLDEQGLSILTQMVM